MKKIYLAIMAAALLSGVSCSGEKESGRIYKQYLIGLAEKAQAQVDEAEEGTAEGEFRDGAKATLQAVIDRSEEKYWDESLTQSEVDEAYGELQEAIIVFEDSMYPFLSEINDLIEQCITLTEWIIVPDEGPTLEDVGKLKTAIAETQAYLAANPDITQRQLDVVQSSLLLAMYDFESTLPGIVSLTVVNHSFELPGEKDLYWAGYENAAAPYTDNWSEVPGWMARGFFDPGMDTWLGKWGENPNQIAKEGVRAMAGKSAPDGDYALAVSNYSLDMWQRLPEGVHVSSGYTLSFDAARSGNAANAATKLRVQLIVFNGPEGDFDNITVLAEKTFTDVADWADFDEKKLTYTVGTSSPYVGQRMVLTFRCFVGDAPATDPGQFVWDGSCTLIDNVRLAREKK